MFNYPHYSLPSESVQFGDEPWGIWTSEKQCLNLMSLVFRDLDVPVTTLQKYITLRHIHNKLSCDGMLFYNDKKETSMKIQGPPNATAVIETEKSHLVF